jgi:pimeloyl-ACP methyl ester carboxylesterase
MRVEIFLSNSRKLFFSGVALVTYLSFMIFLVPAIKTNSPPVLGEWTPRPCAFEGAKKMSDSNVECGYLSVPLRHTDPNGKKIRLAVAIIRYRGEDKAPDPVFYAQGGPGGATLDTYTAMLYSDHAAEAYKRDLVLWDQRGTLHSEPNLICPEVTDASLKEAAENPDMETARRMRSAAFQACAERLEKNGVELSAFNSVENAHDIDFIRRAFGYQKINFYGVSYGTLLGQHLLREHGNSVRSVVLDSVVPSTVNSIEDAVFSKQRISEKYFGGCANDPTCNASLPDLMNRYLDLVERLDKAPVTLSVRDSENARLVRVKLTGRLLEGATYEIFYADKFHRLIPYAIDQAARGDYQLVRWLVSFKLFDRKFSTGVYQTVTCSESGNTDVSKFDHVDLSPRLVRAEKNSAEEFLNVCKSWKIPLLPDVVRAPVASSVPSLLLSGDFDPITPPEYAEIVGKTLQNKYSLVFPNGAHGQMSSDPCAESIMKAFINDPTQRPESSCLDNATGAPF